MIIRFQISLILPKLIVQCDTGNSGGAITHEVEVNMFYKEHVEKV